MSLQLHMHYIGDFNLDEQGNMPSIKTRHWSSCSCSLLDFDIENSDQPQEWLACLFENPIWPAICFLRLERSSKQVQVPGRAEKEKRIAESCMCLDLTKWGRWPIMGFLVTFACAATAVRVRCAGGIAFLRTRTKPTYGNRRDCGA